MGRTNKSKGNIETEKRNHSMKAKRSTPSGSHLGKSNHYKGEFQKTLGNAKTGRGYTLVQNKRLLSRFKKKMTKNQSSHDQSTSSRKTNNKSLMINSSSLDSNATKSPDSLVREKEKSMNGSTISLFKRKKKSKPTNIKRVEIDYNAIQEERKQKAAELQASIAEHEETVATNMQKRRNVSKRLSQRTKRGQPIMANRLELILDKLKKN